MKKVKVSIIQAAPVLFDLSRSVEKTVDLIHQCAKEKPHLILFPESFIPAYPRGLDFGAKVGYRTEEGRKLWQGYWENSVEVPGKETDIISHAAKEARAFVAIGVTEKDTVSGSLYCSLLYFAPSGELIGKHRKIKPTGTERLIWAEGDGGTLTTIDTGFAKIGGLICWENYMPLARMAMYSKGVQIYLAPTADARTSWQTTLQHIAMEGRCFVLGCNQYVEKKDYPPEMQHLISEEPDVMSSGGSVIINPMGEVIAGPLCGEEGILTAELDISEINRAKMDFDVIGHYARPDIFRFDVNGQPESIKLKK